MDWNEVEREVEARAAAAIESLGERFGLEGSDASLVFHDAVSGDEVSEMRQRALDDDRYRDQLHDAYAWCDEHLAAERRAWRRLQTALEWPEGSAMRINQLGKSANELGLETSAIF